MVERISHNELFVFLAVHVDECDANVYPEKD